jgi:hypothetical protein
MLFLKQSVNHWVNGGVGGMRISRETEVLGRNFMKCINSIVAL